MSARMVIELESGDKILFGGRGVATGLSEVALSGEMSEASAEKFKKALGSIADLVSSLQEKIGQMAHRPEKVEMEFRASLSSECDLWIVSGDAEAEFKVKLAWGKA